MHAPGAEAEAASKQHAEGGHAQPGRLALEEEARGDRQQRGDREGEERRHHRREDRNRGHGHAGQNQGEEHLPGLRCFREEQDAGGAPAEAGGRGPSDEAPVPGGHVDGVGRQPLEPPHDQRPCSDNAQHVAEPGDGEPGRRLAPADDGERNGCDRGGDERDARAPVEQPYLLRPQQPCMTGPELGGGVPRASRRTSFARALRHRPAPPVSEVSSLCRPARRAASARRASRAS